MEFLFWVLITILHINYAGMLGPVSDVLLEQQNSTTLRLTFTTPSTLLRVPIDFISVQITSADQTTNTTIMTSSTELFYDPPNYCTLFIFEIAAWNSVGKGEKFSVNTTLYDGKLSRYKFSLTMQVQCWHTYTTLNITCPQPHRMLLFI